MVLKYYSKTVDIQTENIGNCFSFMENPNYSDFQNNILDNKHYSEWLYDLIHFENYFLNEIQ